MRRCRVFLRLLDLASPSLPFQLIFTGVNTSPPRTKPDYLVLHGKSIDQPRAGPHTCLSAFAEKARRLVDLVTTSVLLDAGAGDVWKYTEKSTGFEAGRSEGLGVASFHMFGAGAFSSDPGTCPHRADSVGLKGLEDDSVRTAFQVDDAANPLVGCEGRTQVCCLVWELTWEVDRMRWVGAECGYDAGALVSFCPLVALAVLRVFSLLFGTESISGSATNDCSSKRVFNWWSRGVVGGTWKAQSRIPSPLASVIAASPNRTCSFRKRVIARACVTPSLDHVVERQERNIRFASPTTWGTVPRYAVPVVQPVAVWRAPALSVHSTCSIIACCFYAVSGVATLGHGSGTAPRVFRDGRRFQAG